VDRASARNIEDLLLTKEESFPYLGSLTPDIDAEKLRSATIIAMMNQKPLFAYLAVSINGRNKC
jgi:hypothetical protein